MDGSLDREAVDRILSRAQDLEQGAPPARSGVEFEALIAAASEVGIDPDAVRDSLAIERLSITAPQRSRFDGLAGPSLIVVERELHLTVDEVMSGVEAWLTSLHKLTCVRRPDGSLRARRRSDVSAQVSRVFSTARGDGRISSASLDVEAVPQTVGTTPDRPRTLVRVSGDRVAIRQVRLAGGGSIGGAGIVGGAVAAASDVLVAVPAIALPLVVGGYAIARSGRGHADRLELELEQLLSRVERGEHPAGLIGRIADRARRAAVTARDRRAR